MLLISLSSKVLSDFKLSNIEDRKVEITIIKDRVGRLRKFFNAQFDKCFKQKEAELSRINEKNARIEHIQEELATGFFS